MFGDYESGDDGLLVEDEQRQRVALAVERGDELAEVERAVDLCNPP